MSKFRTNLRTSAERSDSTLGGSRELVMKLGIGGNGGITLDVECCKNSVWRSVKQNHKEEESGFLGEYNP